MTLTTGYLLIAGSGVFGPADITLQTVAYLHEAERVHYLVPDPATQAYLRQHCLHTNDLAKHYRENQSRYESYIEMSEIIMCDVRAGHKVVVIIKGHPGGTASPAHRALEIARKEGYKAKMLPGISPLDSMLADLEIDPSIHGYTVSEATELIAHDRKLNSSAHNIILNIGCIGGHPDNSRFPLLLDKLASNFRSEHRVIHYLAKTTPQSRLAMVDYSIDELRAQDLVNWIRPESALYIPPLTVPDVLATNLDLPEIATLYLGSTIQLKPADESSLVRPSMSFDYGPYVEQAKARLKAVPISPTYRPPRGSCAMHGFLAKLCLRCNLWKRYHESVEAREALLAGVSGLSDIERFALQTALTGPINAVIFRETDAEPTRDQINQIVISAPGGTIHPPMTV